MDQQKNQVGTQTYRKNIDRGIDVPAEPLGELFENDNGGISGANEEHIHLFPKSKLHEAVEPEGNAAQSQKCIGGAPIIRLQITAPFGEAEKQADKNQQHVPDAGMERKEPIAMQ